MVNFVCVSYPNLLSLLGGYMVNFVNGLNPNPTL